MKEVSKKESLKIRGGIGVNYITALVSLGRFFYQLGQTLGNSIKRSRGNVCKA